MSVRVRYKSEKASRIPVEFELEVPNELLYRFINSLREEFQDPESIKNWEMIFVMLTRLVQEFTKNNQPIWATQPATYPPWAIAQRMPFKSFDDVKKFLSNVVGDVETKQGFDEIFNEDSVEPDELKKARLEKQGKKFKSVKVEDVPDKETNKSNDDSKKE